MAGTSIYSVYRRTARAAAKQQVVKKTSSIDVDRARKDFAYFCDVVGDKPPAEHMKLWHEHLYSAHCCKRMHSMALYKNNYDINKQLN